MKKNFYNFYIPGMETDDYITTIKAFTIQDAILLYVLNLDTPFDKLIINKQSKDRAEFELITINNDNTYLVTTD